MAGQRLLALYRNDRPFLYARYRQILGDEATVMDAAQETFLRLYQRLDRASDIQQALAWIDRSVRQRVALFSGCDVQQEQPLNDT